MFCVSQTADTSQCITTGSGCYGLVMASNDQINQYSNSNNGVAWGGWRTTIGAKSASGQTNTATIIAALSTYNSGNCAAWLSHDYRDPAGSHDDWYLPSTNELNKMYLYAKANNLLGVGCIGAKTDGVACLVGSGSSLKYWSSNEYDWENARYIKFSDGVQGYASKWNSSGPWLAVRSVRVFGGGSLVVEPLTKSGYENTDVRFASINFSSKFNSACLVKVKIVSLPTHGNLTLSGVTVTVDQEIVVDNLSNLIYKPNMDYIGGDSFLWNGSNGVQYASDSSSVNINIQRQAPTIVNNNITVEKGQTLTLTIAMLSAISIDNSSTVTYTITSLQHCYFQLTDSIGNHITSFTQQQINSGVVQLVHDGSANIPSFSFVVSGVETVSEVQNAVIHFNNINGVPYVGVLIPKQQGKVDQEFKYTVPSGTFIDPDGDVLSLSAKLNTGASLPGWLNFDKASASFSGTPITKGITSIMLVAEDPSKLTAQTGFDIEILGGDEGGGNWCERNPATCGGVIAAAVGGVGIILGVPACISAYRKLSARSGGVDGKI